MPVLFGVMQLEKWVIYCILCLILLIAAFNMIGALTMLVLEKQKDIAVLKAMGATNQMVQGIFLNEGLVLSRRRWRQWYYTRISDMPCPSQIQNHQAGRGYFLN